MTHFKAGGRAKALSIVLLVLVPALSLRPESGPVRDSRYALILAHLQAHIELLRPDTIKDEVTPARVWEETDAQWAIVMKDFRAMLARQGWAKREDMIRSKEQVHESWKTLCRVLLDRLSEKEAVLRRYDEGSGGSAGYVVLVSGKPKYWLHWSYRN